MAIKFTKGGLQTVRDDPFRRKKKKEPPIEPTKPKAPSGAEIEFERKFGKPFSEIDPREIQRKIEKEINRMAGGLPPTSKMREDATASVLQGMFGVVTPAEKEFQMREEQKGILGREEELREEEVTGLPAEELPPREEEAAVERRGVMGELENVYNFVDTLGGLVPNLEEITGEEILAGTLPITMGGGTVGLIKHGKVALSTGKAATGIRATKMWGGMLKALKSQLNVKKLWKWAAVGYVWVTERRISNIDSALSQVRETLTLPVSMVAAGLPPREGFDKITDLEDDINEYESMLKTSEKWALSVRVTGRTMPIYQRIGKLKEAIEDSRLKIAQIEASGILPTDEESAIMLNDINTVLDNMAKPSKFLGII